jgi:hypothetical protein
MDPAGTVISEQSCAKLERITVQDCGRDPCPRYAVGLAPSSYTDKSIVLVLF